MSDSPGPRRRFLRLGTSLGVFSVAGCLSRGTDGEDGETPMGTRTKSPTPPPTNTETPTPQRTPVSVPFQWNVEILTRQPTAEEPPRVRITVTNDGDEPHNLTTPNHLFPFTKKYPLTGSEARPSLTTGSMAREEGCWNGSGGDLNAPNGQRLAPGDSAMVKYYVVNYSEYGEAPEECWPTESFTFIEDYSLDSSDPSSMDGEAFKWGFRLTITDPPAIHVTQLQPFRT